MKRHQRIRCAICLGLVSLLLVVGCSGLKGGATAQQAQTPQTPDVPTIFSRLHWLGHSCFRLDGPLTIYFDPGVTLRDDAPKADIILISHSHGDHCFSASVKRIIKPDTIILSTSFVQQNAPEYGISIPTKVLRPGEELVIGTVQIEAVPAYNIGEDKPWHKKEYGHLGFIVTIQGERIYHAGDTDRIPEMAQIRCDVALLPIGGYYTMDMKEAAQAAADIKPKIVVPMHTRNEADYEQFRSICNCNVVIMKKE